MTRRRALAVLAVSLVAVVVAAVALVLARTGDAPHVSTLGTMRPSTSMPTSTSPATTQPTPTFPVATTVPPPRPPTSISIPALQLRADVVGVGLVAGTNEVDVPDIDHVGWYDLGPSPGQPGSSVLVGHVDGDGRPGVFFRLGDLVPGDQVIVDDATGSHPFRVTGREQVAKPDLSADLFSRAGPPRLVLITCGGGFDESTGHYLDNVVVVAEPAA